MPDPGPETAGRKITARRLVWPLLAIAIVAAAWGWFIGRPLSPDDRRAEIELCRTKYAHARTHGDTILVDAFNLSPRSRREMHRISCLEYRGSGMGYPTPYNRWKLN